jgi:hypothetical protein
LRLKLKLVLPEQWKINETGPMHYRVSVEGEAGPLASAELNKLVQVPADRRRAELEMQLPLQRSHGEARLRVALAFYYCQEGNSGLCKTGSVVWHVPLKITADGPTTDVPLEWNVVP